MEKIEKILKQFGLNENETIIYLEAIKHEETSPYELAKLTGIPRTTIYDVIMTLSLKGLIELQQSDGFTKQQTKIKAKNPSTLREIIRNRHQDLHKLEVDIVEILPILKGDFHQEKANADFQFFPGIEGAKKTYFDDSAEDIDIPTYTFDCLMPMDAFGINEVNQEVIDWTERRKGNFGSAKEIIALNPWTKHVLSYQFERDPEYIKYREIRYIDNPIFSINQEIKIEGSRVKITTADKDEVWGLIINSKSLAKTLQSLFFLTWAGATPITEGLIKSWGPNQFLKWEKKK